MLGLHGLRHLADQVEDRVGDAPGPAGAVTRTDAVPCAGVVAVPGHVRKVCTGYFMNNSLGNQSTSWGT